MRALVLSGGGAGGAFQVGAIKRLIESGERFDHVIGTSVGALNGFGLRWLGIDGLEEEWLKITDIKSVMRTRLSFYVGLSDSIYCISPLKEKINKIFSQTPKNPSLMVSACVTNILTGEVIYSNESAPEFSKMLLASSSVPLYMPPIDGKFVDGGVREHTPIRHAIRLGYTDITVIVSNELNDESRLKIEKIPSFPFSAIKYGLLATEWLQRELFINDCAIHVDSSTKLRFIYPKRRILDTFEFDAKKIRLAINDGYNAA